MKGNIEVGFKVPNVTFNTRVLDTDSDADNPYVWQPVTVDSMFKEKRVVLFSLPGAFTPTCSTYQLPQFEEMYNQFREVGIDEIYCVSVNDSFVMNAWLDSLAVEKVKPIADGNGDFSRQMGMLVRKEAVDFGYRSHRYSMVVENGLIEMIFVEQGKEDNFAGDPFDVSDVDSMLTYLTSVRDIRRDAIEEAQIEAEQPEQQPEITAA